MGTAGAQAKFPDDSSREHSASGYQTLLTLPKYAVRHAAFPAPDVQPYNGNIHGTYAASSRSSLNGW